MESAINRPAPGLMAAILRCESAAIILARVDMPAQDSTIWIKLGLIFVASGGGGVIRYLLSGWSQKLANGSFPIGTLTVNVLGCFGIGFLTAAFSGRWLLREEYRVALVIGVFGGFTTFSAFGLETFAFLNDGQYARAGVNVGLSVALGLLAVWAGYRLAQNWLGV